LQKDFETILSNKEFWTTDAYPLMESWIVDNSPFLDHLRTIVRCDYLAIPIIDTGFQDHLPSQVYSKFEYEMIVSLGRSLKCRALFFAGNGHWHEAIEDIIAGIYLEWHLLQADQARHYFFGFPPNFLDFAIKVIQTEEFQTDERSSELLVALLETLNACPPRMPDANYFFMSRLQALESVLSMKSMTRETIFESPGLFLVPHEQVIAVIHGASSEFSLFRYKRMTFDWNIVLTEMFKGIEEMEQLSKGLSIEGVRDDTARALVAVQRSKFYLIGQKGRDFDKTVRDNSRHLFLAKRSELLGKLMFSQEFSSASNELGFIDRHETWLRLKREIESLSSQVP